MRDFEDHELRNRMDHRNHIWELGLVHPKIVQPRIVLPLLERKIETLGAKVGIRT